MSTFTLHSSYRATTHNRRIDPWVHTASTHRASFRSSAADNFLDGGLVVSAGRVPGQHGVINECQAVSSVLWKSLIPSGKINHDRTVETTAETPSCRDYLFLALYFCAPIKKSVSTSIDGFTRLNFVDGHGHTTHGGYIVFWSRHYLRALQVQNVR